MNSTNLLNIGMSGLLAFQNALAVTSNNMANASTPFYSRRQIDFAANVFGNGVTVNDVQRIYDAQADQNAQNCNSNYSMFNTLLPQMQNFMSLFQGDTTIGKLINTSLTALNDLNRSPGPATNRDNYYSALVNVTNQFQYLSTQITSQQQTVNLNLQTDVSEINLILGQITTINQQIASMPGQDPGTLLDQREGLMQSLAQFFDFTRSVDDQNLVTLTLSNGIPIVSGTASTSFTTITDPSNTSNVLVAVQSVNGEGATDISDFINSGSIAGLMQYRSNLATAQAGLGRLAIAISDQMNAQNQLGIDGTNNFGGVIFNDINGTSAINNRTMANTNNTGSSSMTVSISDLTQLQTSDYQMVIGPSNTYTMTRLSDCKVMPSGTLSTLPQTITVDGFTMTVNSGTFNAGDKYIISPTNDAAANMELAIPSGTYFAVAWPVDTTVVTQAETSTGKVSVTGITNPSNVALSTPGQLTPPLTIQFVTGTTYNIIDTATGSTIEGPITYNPATNNGAIFPTPGGYDPGYRVSLSNNFAAGDTFNVVYNDKTASDNRNGEAMAKLYQTGVLQNGTATYSQGYNLLAVNVAMETQSAQSSYTSANNLQLQANLYRDRVSGVSLQEETMNLVQYQQAYQACAQVLQAAKHSFDIILGLMR